MRNLSGKCARIALRRRQFCWAVLTAGISVIWGASASVKATTVQVSNAGFEMPVIVSGAFIYAPQSAGWNFSSGAGVANPSQSGGSASSFGGYTPPNGSQYGFLQGVASVSQPVLFSTQGSYELSFYVAGRRSGQVEGKPDDGNQEVKAQIDSAMLLDVHTVTDEAFQIVSVDFAVPAGTHMLTISALDPATGDNTALIDAVSISAVPEPASAGVFIGAAIGIKRWRRSRIRDRAFR